MAKQGRPGSDPAGMVLFDVHGSRELKSAAVIDADSMIAVDFRFSDLCFTRQGDSSIGRALALQARG